MFYQKGEEGGERLNATTVSGKKKSPFAVFAQGGGGRKEKKAGYCPSRVVGT